MYRKYGQFLCSRQKLSTYIRVGNIAGAWMHRSEYVQEVWSVFMFLTKTKYLHPCRQYRGGMDAKERVFTLQFSTI